LTFPKNNQEVLIVGGSLTINGDTSASVAQFVLENSTWITLGLASDVPGPVVAIEVNNYNASSIFAAGRYDYFFFRIVIFTFLVGHLMIQLLSCRFGTALVGQRSVFLRRCNAGMCSDTQIRLKHGRRHVCISAYDGAVAKYTCSARHH